MHLFFPLRQVVISASVFMAISSFHMFAGLMNLNNSLNFVYIQQIHILVKFSALAAMETWKGRGKCNTDWRSKNAFHKHRPLQETP